MVNKFDEIELSKWKKRIWHPEFEYKGGDKPCETYDKLYDKEDFFTLKFDTKEELYEFLDYGIRFNKIRNNFVQFIRSGTFDVYIISDYTNIEAAYSRIVEMIEDSKSCKDKFIICDNLSTEFDVNLAGYLCMKLKKNGCRSLIYCTDEDANVINDFYYCINKKDVCDNYLISGGKVINDHN